MIVNIKLNYVSDIRFRLSRLGRSAGELQQAVINFEEKLAQRKLLDRDKRAKLLKRNTRNIRLVRTFSRESRESFLVIEIITEERKSSLPSLEQCKNNV